VSARLPNQRVEFTSSSDDETAANHEPLDEVELEMKQHARLINSFSRLGWYDDREAVIAFCEAREKAQGL